MTPRGRAAELTKEKQELTILTTKLERSPA